MSIQCAKKSVISDKQVFVWGTKKPLGGTRILQHGQTLNPRLDPDRVSQLHNFRHRGIVTGQTLAWEANVGAR